MASRSLQEALRKRSTSGRWPLVTFCTCIVDILISSGISPGPQMGSGWLCCKKSTDLLEWGEKSTRGRIMTEQHPFKRRHFQAEIILLCVRWYLRYSLSYRESSRDDGGARTARRSYDHLSLGSALRARDGETLPTSPQSHQRLVACR
jgi:hypothetical protein